MTTVAAPTRWTYHDYLRLDDDHAYQVVEGDLIVSPAPSIVHQRVSSRLYTSLQSFVSERNLGEVFYAPVDVVFGEHDIVQPDLLFVRRENAGIVGQQAVEGTPDLIIEILSPGSLHLDRHRKRALYERVGVPEFWLVDPANRAIEVFRLGDLAEHVRVHIALGVAVLHRHAVEHVHHPGQSLPFIDTGSILM